MIAIVDYGLGNILAFATSYKRMGIDVAVAKSAADLAGATKIILPGVGSFDHAMELLNGSGMRASLDELVVAKKTPVLGICVGMQILGRSSEEGSAAGLGWIDGTVAKLGAERLPHMGWNDVAPRAADGLFDGLETGARFYFLHSYYFRCANEADVLATSEYGAPFACAVRHGNVYGVQFHPEKSHRFGTRLLENFAVRA
jgi:glutamine amidotransferase